MAVRKDEVNLQVTIGAESAGSTLRELKKEARDIRRALERIPVGTKEFDDARTKLKAVTDQIAAAEGRTKQLVQQTGFWQRALAGAVGVFGALSFDNILDRMVQLGTQLFNVGTGLDSLQNKTRTVFEDATEVVQGFAEQNAESLGLSQRGYVDLATSTGDLLKPMGFATDAVAELSAAVVNQAGVFPEWTQGKVTTTQAQEILTKSLLGERDALNTLGIDIKDSIIQEELKRKGLDDLTGASRRQAEALITLEQITLQSASANEAFANGADSSLRKQAEFSAKIAEITDFFSRGLIPVFNLAINVGLRLLNFFIAFGRTLVAIPGFVRDNQVALTALGVALVTLNAQGIAAAANTLRLAVAQRGAAIAAGAQAAAQRILNFVLAANPIGLVIAALATLTAVFVSAYKGSETFRRVVTGTFTSVQESIRNTIGFFTDLGSGLINLFSGNFEAAIDSFGNAFNRLNPAEIGKSLKDSFVKGYDSIPSPKAVVDPDIAAAEEAGSDTGKAFADRIAAELERLGETGEKGAKSLAEAAKKALDLRLKEIEAGFLKEELVTDAALFKKEISESDHGKKVLELKRTQYEQQIAAFRQFNQLETKDALEAQKKLLEITQQLAPQKVAPLAGLGAPKIGGVTSQTAGIAGADISAADDELVLREKFARIVTLEQANELARLDIQRNALNARLEFLRNAGLQESAVFQETLGAKLKADEDYQAAIVENERRSAELKKKVQEASYQVASDFFQLAIDLLGQDEKARKKNAAAIKSFQAANVFVQGIAEVQKIWANAAELGPIAGPIIGALQTAVAVGRTVLALGKISSTKFATGGLAKFGFFGGKPHSAGGTKGYFDDGTTLEVERDEAFAIVNRRNAPLLRALSNINSLDGNGVPFFARGGMPKFATGGLPTVNTTPNGASPQAAAQPLLSNMTGFIEAVDEFGMLVRQFPREVKSRVVYTELRDTASEVATVEADAAI